MYRQFKCFHNKLKELVNKIRNTNGDELLEIIKIYNEYTAKLSFFEIWRKIQIIYIIII